MTSPILNGAIQARRSAPTLPCPFTGETVPALSLTAHKRPSLIAPTDPSTSSIPESVMAKRRPVGPGAA